MGFVGIIESVEMWDERFMNSFFFFFLRNNREILSYDKNLCRYMNFNGVEKWFFYG